MNVLKSINQALHKILESDERAVLIGEDIADPYGGAFKVTKGLTTRFPDRTYRAPISEAGFVGIAAGMAMRGMRPVVEIMFGDFLMLAADQLLNHIAKYRWMYNDQVRLPLVIRAPMGGRRGYGPTHSQSVEKHFLGMPGLRVVACNSLQSPGALLEHAALHDDDPVIFVENKLMYAQPVHLPEGFHQMSDGPYPTLTWSLEPLHQAADLTLVTYGAMASLALEVAEELMMEEELVCQVVVPSSLNPLDLQPILRSLQCSGRLLVAEEGTQTLGWGAEVIRRVATEGFSLLKGAPAHVAALDLPIANTPTLESVILPQKEDLMRAALGMIPH